MSSWVPGNLFSLLRMTDAAEMIHTEVTGALNSVQLDHVSLLFIGGFMYYVRCVSHINI